VNPGIPRESEISESGHLTSIVISGKVFRASGQACIFRGTSASPSRSLDSSDYAQYELLAPFRRAVTGKGIVEDILEDFNERMC
jgi:hypothetical protein